MDDLPLYQLAIQAALDFANMPQIESVDQVHALFAALPLPKARFKTIKPHEVQAFRDDQAELKRWLEQIAKRGGVTPKVREEIARRVQAIELTDVRMALTDTGEVQLSYLPHFSGVQACYGFATALLLDPNRRDRLRRCALYDCEKFFLGKDPRQRFCCPRHANTDRQRAFRRAEKSPRGGGPVKRKKD